MFPILWLSMMMSDGKNSNDVFLDAKNHIIRKEGNSPASNLVAKTLVRFRVIADIANGFSNLGEKLSPQTSFRLIPVGCSDGLSIRFRMNLEVFHG